MRFNALIDGVHFDPKKGAVKIQLVATLHDVSLDELTTLSPKDEPVHVTLDSEQTKIGVFTPNAGDPITLEGEDAVLRLKESAERLKADGEEV